MRKLACGVAGVALVLPLVLVVSPAGARSVAARRGVHLDLSASEARALSTGVTDHVIIVLRDEPTAGAVNGPEAAARFRAIATAQAPILSDLRQTAARKVRAYSLVDAVSATVSAGEASRLAADPSVREVIPDVAVRGPDVPEPAPARRRRRPPPPHNPAPHPPGRLSGPGPTGACGRGTLADRCRQQLVRPNRRPGRWDSPAPG